MTTLTDKKAYEGIEKFLRKHPGKSNTYVIAVADGVGKITLHERVSLPCFGELRVYDTAKDGVTYPTDLHYPFPDGRPVGLGVSLSLTTWAEFIFTDEASPFHDLVGKCELVRDKDKAICGVLFFDTSFNSDILISALFACRGAYEQGRLTIKSDDPFQRLADFLCAVCKGRHGAGKWMNSQPFNLWRIATGTPDVPKDWNWGDRAAYRRPVIEYIWRDHVPSVRWKDGTEHAGYGPIDPKTKKPQGYRDYRGIKTIISYDQHPAPDPKENVSFIDLMIGAIPGKEIEYLAAKLKEAAAAKEV